MHMIFWGLCHHVTYNSDSDALGTVDKGNSVTAGHAVSYGSLFKFRLRPYYVGQGLNT